MKGRACILSNRTDNRDPFCKEFLAPEVCIECANRYFINGFGLCEEVNPLCNNYDKTTGFCLSCYPGFAVEGGTCIETTS